MTNEVVQMKRGRFYSWIFWKVLLILVYAASVSAQLQSINGQIEGTTVDGNGQPLAAAEIVATNLTTGVIRRSMTDREGFYRLPLLTLGAYRVSGAVAGFKQVIRDGINLAAGETITVDFRFEPGDVEELVTVSGDTPVADGAKTDLGRLMNSREIHNVPLSTRNPYNLVIQQANISGRPNRSQNYPQFNVNGFLRRVHYLLDGSNNTRGDVAGARHLFISETYIREMQLLTPGFSAEFGNTTGMVVNMVTPSGSNEFRGSAMYLFSRPSFHARPFFFSGQTLPDSDLKNVAATIGGPIIKDRSHFYFGYEWMKRVDSTRGNRQSTVTETDRLRLIDAGLPASIFSVGVPIPEYAAFYIFRTDVQLNGNNQLVARVNHSDSGIENQNVGGLNTSERGVDSGGVDTAAGVQLISFTPKILNELRVHFAASTIRNVRNFQAGATPGVTITNVASFGSPQETAGSNSVSFFQFHDNLTWARGSHSVKIGGAYTFRYATNRSETSAQYTFPSIDAYEAARRGVDPYSYSHFQETFGDPETRSATASWSFFVQDDWKINRRLKLIYGLRYDLYVPPDADPYAPFSTSRAFNTDTKNLAPRLALAFTLREGRRPLVLRVGSGFYFEPPWMGMYTKALLTNGAPKFFNLRFCGNNGGPSCPRDQLAPAFPNIFSGSQPPGSSLPPQNIVTIAPDLQNMYAIHSNVQLEQALTDDLSVAVSYFRSVGRHIPVYRSINPSTPIRNLSDGRPVFGPERLDPRFNLIQIVESAGISQYDAMTVQITQRTSRGIQLSASYTLSRAVDDAPEQEVTYSDGFRNQRALADPTDRSFDKGYSYGDQRHTVVMSMVARPKLEVGHNIGNYVLNNNQIGVLARANSGERFSVISGRFINNTLNRLDLNGDGMDFPDRPVGFKRNSETTPPQLNFDLRYSRIFDLSERFRFEAFCDIQNLFNINNIVAYSNVLVPTHPVTGELIGALPDFKARMTSISIESRQTMIGLRFHF
jgi:hypothetical protein